MCSTSLFWCTVLSHQIVLHYNFWLVLILNCRSSLCRSSALGRRLIFRQSLAFAYKRRSLCIELGFLALCFLSWRVWCMGLFTLFTCGSLSILLFLLWLVERSVLFGFVICLLDLIFVYLLQLSTSLFTLVGGLGSPYNFADSVLLSCVDHDDHWLVVRFHDGIEL